MCRLLTLVSSMSIILSLLVTPVSAGTISFPFEIETSRMEFVEPSEGDLTVEVEGFNHTNYIGFPSLPYRTFGVLIPQGEEVAGYHVDILDSVLVDSSIPLSPFRGDLLTDGTRRGIIAEGEDVLTDDGEFPRSRIRYLGSSSYKGYRIASFAVYPFRYNIKSNRLMLEKKLRVVIDTEPASGFPLRLERMRHVDGFREAARRRVESMVVNPWMCGSYSFSDIRVNREERRFLPSYLPSMEGSEVKYLIITDDEMSSAFQRLASWKTRKGVPAVVRTLSWISQNYRSGADLAESIRIFIQEAYAKWGVEWVCLGGDTDIIPARFAYTTFYSGEFIPTDMYYSCLDGTWNADRDSLWGEGYKSAEEPGDDADLYSEVYLGRIPVSNYSDANLMVDKLISYSTPVDSVSKGKFTFLAEVIFPPDYTEGDDIILDGAEMAQSIYTPYLETNTDIVTSRLYETCDMYTGSICISKSVAIDSLNAGTNHVVHVGHGYKYNMSVGSGSILNYDAKNLINGEALFSMYLMNCTNVAFDTDCLAEYFLLNQNGGAFAITGSSRSAFPSASKPYMDDYYRLYFNHNIVQLGRTYTESREDHTPAAYGETSDRWTHFIYNYLGDPEISSFKSEAVPFQVSIPSSAEFGPNGIDIQVNSEGAPFDSALVCLYKEGDDYQYALTNGSGMASFNDFYCKDEGWIKVTVTGLNHCRFQDSIQVLEEMDPYLRISDRSVSDDISGNDDGVVDAGEELSIYIELENTGQSDAEDIYAILSSSDTAVTITDSTALYPDIQVGRDEYPNDGFVMSFDAATQDEQVVEFTLNIHDSTGGYWPEKFALEIHSHQLEQFVNQVSDQVPYGDGDGEIEDYEQYVLKVGIKNFGSGLAYGMQAKLRSSDPDVNITDSVSVYNDIATIQTEYGDGFVLSEDDVSSDNYVTFELTDYFGRKFTAEMELRRPAAPVNLTFDSSFGPTEIHVTWNNPDSLENYRYLVYHSTSPGGPYEMVSKDLVGYTLFRDYGLNPSSSYYYRVTCVDSCGNESNYSDEGYITTNPPYQTGWPNIVEKETASSPNIGDIDGDRHPEIVVGSDYVYAWHEDGVEVIDGDNKPLTWGVLNTEGSTFTASVALAELDDTLGMEIIAASWDTDELFVFNSNGNNLPGWPKTLEQFCWASPVAGDFDGDGELDIIAYDILGNVYVWHSDGTEFMDGDGNPATDGVFFQAGEPEDGWHVCTPALADMDGDNVVELIVSASLDSTYCLNSDGTSVPGWPVPLADSDANVTASPVAGDIDNDGYMEVVVRNSAGRVSVINHDGTVMDGWPRWAYNGSSFFAGSPALADLTGDGRLEVVVPANDSKCYIYRYDGTQLPNWPQPYSSGGTTESSPVIADIDNNDSLDVILGCEEGYINAWDINGNLLAGFPIKLSSFVRGTPMVKDIDFDGDIELVASCWDRKVYIWDMPASRYYGFAPWNGFHGNEYNSGWKEFEGVTGAKSVSCMFRYLNGNIELRWTTSLPEMLSWDLYRRCGDSDYEMIASGLEADQTGSVKYSDLTVEEGLVYTYKIEAREHPELFAETERIEIPVTTARLYQNHPNPFNPSTSIAFTIPGGSDSKMGVVLNIYDVRGALVKTLVNDVMPGGRYKVSWNGKNSRGSSVASGVYFARLAVGSFRSTRKMILLR